MFQLIFSFVMIFASNSSEDIYRFKAKDLSGETIDLERYRGKVLLIVNTASECGFTPQYAQLEELYQTYKNRGFCVLAFPSNDFGGQEPLNGNQIQAFCSQNFDTTFPIFDKIHVKGDKAHPLYQFLSNKSLNGKVDIAPKWNFQKYLIDKNGKVIDYYLSTTSPTSGKVKKAIETLLTQ